jgi:hypothetical protein
MRLSRLPVIVRVLFLAIATGLGLTVGFILGLGLIGLVQAVAGHFPSHSLRGFALVAGAYGVTGLSGLAALVIAWRGLFRGRQ